MYKRIESIVFIFIAFDFFPIWVFIRIHSYKIKLEYEHTIDLIPVESASWGLVVVVTMHACVHAAV